MHTQPHSLYRGLLPATTGTFFGHGVRTLTYEACLRVLSALGVPELQVLLIGTPL